MKWIIPVCAAVMAACTYAPVVQDPNGGIMATDAGDVRETQRLEQTESDCASQGKHAEASRVEGHTVYSCVD